MNEHLKRLLQRELDELEIKEEKLTRLYAAIDDTIKVTSQLTGIPQDELICTCVRTAHHYGDLTWHDILDIVRSFVVLRDQLEQEKREAK